MKIFLVNLQIISFIQSIVNCMKLTTKNAIALSINLKPEGSRYL